MQESAALLAGPIGGCGAFEVVHAIPGRVRLRVPAIRGKPEAAEAVATRLSATKGVLSARANHTSASVVVNYDTAAIRTFVPEKHLAGLRFEQVGDRVRVSEAGRGALPPRENKVLGFLRRFASLVVPSAALVFSVARRLIPVAPVYGLVAAAAAPVFGRALSTLRRERRLGVDFLDATALSIMGIQRNLPTCAFMSWLISVGEYIREQTARKSQSAISEMLAVRVQVVTVIRGCGTLELPLDRLAPGMEVVVRSGDAAPVDGTVVCGRAAIDQSSLTGESALVETGPGSKVYAGTIAVDGELIVKAESVGLDTRIGRIVKMLQEAPLRETRVEDYAARLADRLVIPTFLLAGAVYTWARSLSRALSVIIIDFGTGVRVAAPTAILSFMAHAARNGVAIKGGKAMEKLATADTVVFDKTGTLTTGTPVVTEVALVDRRRTVKSALRFAALLEQGQNHPVASAVLAEAALRGVRVSGRVEARLSVGMGVRAVANGQRVAAGSEPLMNDESIDLSKAREIVARMKASSVSPLYLAVDGRLVAVIGLADAERPECADVIDGLRSLGIKKLVMLTGDRDSAAAAVARTLGIDEWHSELLPQEKSRIVQRLQKEGRTVAFIGDGINDSLALSQADVSIAPAHATDAAKEAAGVLLLRDDLNLLVEGFAIARSALRLVKQNFGVVAVPNASGIALAASGLVGPAAATFINNGSTVAAALNSLRPLIAGRGNGVV